MGLFHKTLIDARKAVQQGRYNAARDILKVHLKYAADVKNESSLARLGDGIVRHEAAVRSAIEQLSQQRVLPQSVVITINGAIEYLEAIRRRIERLKEWVMEEK